MKDLLNIKIVASKDGDVTRITIFHRKRRDVAFSFKVQNTIEATRIPALLKWVMRSWINEYTQKTRRELTRQQSSVYQFILRFHEDEMRMPTYDEIADGLGYATRGTVHSHIKNIIAKGWLWRDEDNKIVPYDVAAPEASD